LLEGALEAFAGAGAAAARSEGSSCVRSAVDHRPSRRMVSEVLDHAPTHADIQALLGRVQTAVDARGVALHGITTDGAGLSPEPLRAVCGEGPHQMCPCHVLKERVKGGVKAGASERERLAQSRPTVQRGRPSAQAQEARRSARKRTHLPQKSSD
jgi:hypothetical protein